MTAATLAPTVPAAETWKMKARGAGLAIVTLLAVNGAAPILGHTPAGIWDKPVPVVEQVKPAKAATQGK